MSDLLLVASNEGLVVCEQKEDTWLELRRGLSNYHVSSVIAREGVILAGTTEGVFCSEDLGQSWYGVNKGLTTRQVRWLAYHPDISDFECAGTEPAGIFISRDGAKTWRECSDVPILRYENDWYLPYSPEAGCVRGFAFNGSRIYAAVEVGGVLRSDDYGETWQLIAGASQGRSTGWATQSSLHPDVHSIAVHPLSADLVFAPTGGGLYRSENGGKTWTHIYAHCYCRAVWINPNDVNHIIAGVADAVDYQGRLEQTLDGGQTWEAISKGLLAPWPNYMVERLSQVNDSLLAVLSNGVVVAAPLATLKWRFILRELTGVNAVTMMG